MVYLGYLRRIVANVKQLTTYYSEHQTCEGNSSLVGEKI